MRAKLRIPALALLALMLMGCSQPQVQLAYIGADAAKSYALQASGAPPQDAVFSGTDMGSRNGLDYYLVTFTAAGQEYSYHIDALSGVVIDGGPSLPGPSPESAATPAPTPSPTPAPEASPTPARPSPPPTPTPRPESHGGITAAEAKAKALSQVPGATESHIREFETDYDDGRLEYEGKIYYEEMEYEFEIDGYSGSIRSWDAESIYD